MISHNLITNGFDFISQNHYLNNENFSSVHDLKKAFDTTLEEDGVEFRKRAYLKLIWNKEKKEIQIAKNQTYYQSQLNKTDGGKIRRFKVMPKAVLDIPIVQNILLKNLQIIEHYPQLASEKEITIGMHFIRYQTRENGASYSSPPWLHKDDEPLVFIHLINLSKSALGGDNLIADIQTEKVTHVIRLEDEMDTLVLNQNVYHAVTPLGSKQGTAIRDVILFTVEPHYTQIKETSL